MFFLSVPQAWHLVGTWSEQLPNDANLIGMGVLPLEFMKNNNKSFEELVNSDKEINKLKKTIFDEAVNTKLDYEENNCCEWRF